ncbi:MAG: hypothetical protein RL391_48 [Actinomycetota bacterium]|jgi:hypothetical protein
MRPMIDEVTGTALHARPARGIHQRRDPRNYRLTRGTPSERR